MDESMSILCAMSIIYYLYLGIIPILIYPDFLQFIALVSLIAAVVIPLSGIFETKFMERNDDDEIGSQEPYQHPAKTIEVK